MSPEFAVVRGELEEILSGKTVERLNGLGKPVTTLINFAEYMNRGKQGESQTHVNDLERKMGLVPNTCEYEVRVYENYPTGKNPRVALVAMDRYSNQERVLMCMGERSEKMLFATRLRPDVNVVAYVEFADFGNPETDGKRIVQFLTDENQLCRADAGGGFAHAAFAKILANKSE